MVAVEGEYLASKLRHQIVHLERLLLELQDEPNPSQEWMTRMREVEIQLRKLRDTLNASY